MKLQALRENWRIVVVVTGEQLHLFDQTMQAVREQSFSREVSVLAADEHDVRKKLSTSGLDVDFSLPAQLPQNARWVTILARCTPNTEACVFLFCGTDVPPHWDARLAAAGQRAGDLAVVSPLCVRDPVLGVFTEHDHSPGLEVDAIDQWLNDYSSGVEFSVPVLSQCCLYVPGALIAQLAVQASDDTQLVECIRSANAGPLATNQLYVDDQKLDFIADLAALPPAWQEAFTHRSPLAALRHSITELSLRGEAPPELTPCLPVQLHVGHSWGGGLSRWMEDYIRADSSCRQLILRSVGDLTAFGQAIALYASPDSQTPIRTWALCEPILSVSAGSAEYRRIIEELVSEFGVEAVIVSSLIGHSVDILQTALPTTVVLHEFFPFCPALYATFDTPCQSCDADRLESCMRDNPRNAFFRFESPRHWLSTRKKFVDAIVQDRVTVVAPSQSVVDRYRQLEARLLDKQIHVIPHGLAGELEQSLRRADVDYTPNAERRLKLVVLGRLTDEKGGELLSRMLPTLTDFSDVWLLGTGESGAEFEGVAGVEVVRSYSSEELGDLLAQVLPDLGLILSTVPETFSYTLSELRAAGIPVLATRMGALQERIVDGESGWLSEPTADSLLTQIQRLNAGRREQRSALDVVRRFLASHREHTASDMVAAYAEVLPRPQYIPLHRYRLPRRSFSNPYTQPESEQSSAAIVFGAQQPYRHILIEFLRYSARKAEVSPRLHPSAGRVLASMLRKVAQWAQLK